MNKAFKYILLIQIFIAFTASGKDYTSEYHNVKFDSVAFYIIPVNAKTKSLNASKLPVVYKNTIPGCYQFYKSIPVKSIAKFNAIIDDPTTFKGNYLLTQLTNSGLVFFYQKQIVAYVSFHTQHGVIKFSHKVPAYEENRIEGESKGTFTHPTMSPKGVKRMRDFFKQNGISIPLAIPTVD